MSEPARSSGTKSRCENCGESAGPRFCPHCGQEVEARHGPLLAVGREFLSDWLSLDSKLLRSLRALLRPAHLSEQYLGGKRAPYLRPFRLYLVASVVLFSTVLTLAVPDAAEYEITIAGQRVGQQSSDERTIEVGAKTAKVRKTLDFWNQGSVVGRWFVGLAGDRIGRLRTSPPETVVATLFTGLRRMLPLALVLFVPLLALVLKLLYIRRRALRHLYLDHLVFAVHFQTALFFGVSAAWLVARLARLEAFGNLLVAVGVWLVILVLYLPLALRRFYGQSRLVTAVKSIVVLFLYFQLLGLVVNLSTLAAIWGV